MAQPETEHKFGESDADAVTDGRGGAADKPLKKPGARHQRRSQRQAEEQGAESDSTEIQPQQIPRPGHQRVPVFDVLFQFLKCQPTAADPVIGIDGARCYRDSRSLAHPNSPGSTPS
ncbi:Uncharacterised protein [Mycobacteroides abscessus subsp. abscessus]|nr:Uncharacterised protein [Mycobacteroides abscessus subsp. abscessus]